MKQCVKHGVYLKYAQLYQINQTVNYPVQMLVFSIKQAFEIVF